MADNPVQAVAGAPQVFAYAGAPFDVTLDGSASTTTNAGAVIVQYSWSLKSKAPGSSVALIQPLGTSNPSATLVGFGDVEGACYVFLRVKDSTGAWSDDLLVSPAAAKTVVTMRTQIRDWSVPAAGETDWDAKAYALWMDIERNLDTQGRVRLHGKAGEAGIVPGVALYVDGYDPPTGLPVLKICDGTDIDTVNQPVFAFLSDLTGGVAPASGAQIYAVGLGAVTIPGVGAPVLGTAFYIGADGMIGTGGGVIKRRVGEIMYSDGDSSFIIMFAGMDQNPLIGDESTLAKSATGILGVKALGIGPAQLGSVAGAGLTGGAGSALAINFGAGVENASGALRLKLGAGLEFGIGSVVEVDIDNSTIKVGAGGLYADLVPFTPDNVTLRAVLGIAEIKPSGVGLTEAGLGIFVDPGRPDSGVLGLTAGAFLGGEVVQVQINGATIATFTATTGQAMADFASAVNAVSARLKATVLGTYCDVVMMDRGDIASGLYLDLVIGGTANANLVREIASEALAASKCKVVGTHRRINTFDSTRGVVVFDFGNTTIKAALVQVYDGSNNVIGFNGKVTFSGSQVTVDNSGATVPFASGFMTCLAYASAT